MVTQTEINERLRRLKELEEQAKTILQRRIPQRRFGFGVSRSEQQGVIQDKEQAQRVLENIEEERRELTGASKQLTQFQQRQAQLSREESAFRQAEKLIFSGKEFAAQGDPEVLSAIRELKRKGFRSADQLIAERKAQQTGSNLNIPEGFAGQSTEDGIVLIETSTGKRFKPVASAKGGGIIFEEERRTPTKPPKPQGVVDVAPTFRERFKERSKSKNPFIASLEVGGEQIDRFIDKFDQRTNQQGQTFGRTEFFKKVTPVAPFLIPATAPASFTTSGVLTFTSKGGRASISSTEKSILNFAKEKDIAISGKTARAVAVGIPIAEIGLGGIGGVRQTARATGFPKFNTKFVSEPVLTTATKSGSKVVLSESKVLVTQKNLLSTKTFKGAVLSESTLISGKGGLGFTTKSKGTLRRLGFSLPSGKQKLGKPITFTSKESGVAVLRKDTLGFLGGGKTKEVGRLRLDFPSPKLKRTFTEEQKFIFGGVGKFKGDKLLTAGLTAPLESFPKLKFFKQGRGVFAGISKSKRSPARIDITAVKGLTKQVKLTPSIKQSSLSLVGESVAKQSALRSPSIALTKGGTSSTLKTNIALKSVSLPKLKTTPLTKTSQSPLLKQSVRGASSLKVSQKQKSGLKARTKTSAASLSGLGLKQPSLLKTANLLKSGLSTKQASLFKQKTVQRGASIRPPAIKTPLIPPSVPLLPLFKLPDKAFRSSKKKKKKRFGDDLFIVPGFTSRVLNLKESIRLTDLPKRAGRLETGLGLRKIPSISLGSSKPRKRRKKK